MTPRAWYSNMRSWSELDRTAAVPMIRASSIARSPGRGSLAKGRNRASCKLCVDGRPVQAKWAFILFFEPFKYLRCSDRPFRQMRIECARADIWRVDQFRSREFLGLSLVRKCFGRPCVRSLSRSKFKRNVPGAFGLVSHDTLARATSAAHRPWAGPQSKANEIVPLATCQPSGFVFRRGRYPGQPSEPERTSGAPGVMESDRLFVPLQFPLSPMRIFARRIEHPLDVPVQCPHNADARHHGRAVVLDDQEHGFDRRLPLGEILLGFGQLHHDVTGGVLEGDKLATAGKGNRIDAGPLPALRHQANKPAPASVNFTQSPDSCRHNQPFAIVRSI